MFRKYRSYSNHTTLLLRVRWKLLKTLLFLAYHRYFWSGNINDVFSFSQYFCFFFGVKMSKEKQTKNARNTNLIGFIGLSLVLWLDRFQIKFSTLLHSLFLYVFSSIFIAYFPPIKSNSSTVHFSRCVAGIKYVTVI